MLGKIEGRRRRGQQRMRWLDGITDSNGHEFEQTLEDSEGQGSLACCSPWDLKESDTTERLNNNNLSFGRTPRTTRGVLLFWDLAWPQKICNSTEALLMLWQGWRVTLPWCPTGRAPPGFFFVLRHGGWRSPQSLEFIHSMCFLPDDLPDPFQTELGRCPETFTESCRCLFGRVLTRAKQCWFCGWCREIDHAPRNQGLTAELSSRFLRGSQARCLAGEGETFSSV